MQRLKKVQRKLPLMKLIGTGLLLTVSVGCSKSLDSYPERQVFQAPQEEAELGQIATGLSEKEVAELLETYPEASFRVLNRSRGIFEIIGVHKEALQARLEGSVLSDNEMVKFEIPAPFQGFKPIMPPSEAGPAFEAPSEEEMAAFLKASESVDFFHLDQISNEESLKTSSGEGIVIAVVDSGISYNHPGLHSQIALNEGEIPENGIDDDRNGLVDDYVGYDFLKADHLPNDDYGHGTHVSGLSAGLGFGVAPGAKILPIKALGRSGGDIGTLVASIYYALDREVQVINLSLGQYVKVSRPILEALSEAESQGVVIVAASGNGLPGRNGGVNTDKVPNVPSALPFENIISVASRGDAERPIAVYSNFGARTVDVIAPGGDIKRSLSSASFDIKEHGYFVALMGTSMASPVVAGVVAQILAVNDGLSPAEVRQILLQSGQEDPSLKGYSLSSRYLDGSEAVNSASTFNFFARRH